MIAPQMLGILQFTFEELSLFVASGFLLFAIDDFCVDLVWLTKVWRAGPSQAEAFEAQEDIDKAGAILGPVAIFVPAWQESEVIGKMLRRCVDVWRDHDYLIFVGTYANDEPTRSAVERVGSAKIICVGLEQDGPTTKADCLNGLWSALLKFEAGQGCVCRAIVLHDAEDAVHAAEIELFARTSQHYALTQIPVIPVGQMESRWIAGHYLDEFAEAHQKELPVRQMCGASVPSAGTGCAISREALGAISKDRLGLPFDADSLTEDYELGLNIWQKQLNSAFVRYVDGNSNSLVAVKSCFPSTIAASVRQKSRWIIGIALAGWDRTGWHGGWAEHWMRWRDRRTMLAAFIIFLAYVTVILGLALGGLGSFEKPANSLGLLLIANSAFFFWRILLRFNFTAQQYGFVEGLWAIPRMFISNIITVMAAWRAFLGYLRLLTTGKVSWEKTEHVFPWEEERERR